MANILIYTLDEYDDKYNKVFAGVYNDFRTKAVSEYKFELAPLEYDEFIKSVKDDLIKCIILFEEEVPTAFLAYTTVISECVELNIIHCLGDENSLQKRCLLLDKFIESNEKLISQKTVTYPLLGKQEELIDKLIESNFKTVNQSVTAFDFNKQDAIERLREKPLPALNNGFRITEWKEEYFYSVAELIHSSFREMSDAYFDSRFQTLRGTQDIIAKITSGIYGEFLPEKTKVMTYKDKPIAVCFVNLTNPSIANVPLVAVNAKYRGKSYGIYVLKSAVTAVYQDVLNVTRQLTEINASCDSDNLPAVKMYEAVGFKERYVYKQAYRPADIFKEN